eukprot:5579074-Ditylum_brightwellii.AAC.1
MCEMVMIHHGSLWLGPTIETPSPEIFTWCGGGKGQMEKAREAHICENEVPIRSHWHHQRKSNFLIALYHQYLGPCHAHGKEKSAFTAVPSQPQVEVTINNDGNTDKEWITSTTSDAVGRLQPVKVLTSQLFYNFDELTRPYGNFPAHLIGDVINNSPETDSINPPFGDDDLCIVSLPVVILMSYEYGLTAGNLNSHQLEQMEVYHPSMCLWGNTMQYQFSSRSGMPALTLRANDVLDNCGF